MMQEKTGLSNPERRRTWQTLAEGAKSATHLHWLHYGAHRADIARAIRGSRRIAEKAPREHPAPLASEEI